MKYKIGIIGGYGIMGKFFKKVFERYNVPVFLWGRKSKISLKDFVKDLDIIIVSVPIDATEKVIEYLGEFLTPNQCITDLTSLKEFPMKTMQKKTKAKFFGMHPMFAPPISGTMQGQNIVFCEGNATAEQEFFEEIFTKDGAICISVTPEEHDTLMTIVQGLSHFLDIAFIRTLHYVDISVEKIFASRSPAYALKMMLAGRTLYQNANLYGNIQIQNPRNIQTLKTFFDISNELYSIIQEKNLKKFEKIFEEEKKYLGTYAKKSQEESDKIIDYLANKILQKKKKYNKKNNEKKGNIPCSKESKIGVLGPLNTFSYIAGEKFFGSTKNLHLFPSIPALFSAYKKEKISEIFVPMENMLHGSVAETIDGIVQSDLKIQKIFEMKISPSLFTPIGVEKDDITQIYSHPQALAQCSDFLEKNFPYVKFIPVSSTAEGVEKILQSVSSAAIASPEMTKKYKVKTLFSNIANSNKNATRFAHLSPKNTNIKNFSHSKNSVFEGGIIFAFAKDAPGTLESVLRLFSFYKINLTKIESRPTGEGFGEYSFFVTYSGILSPTEKKQIFEKIQKKVSEFRFLGEFEIIRE